MPASAQEEAVDLELVLAVDISFSMDPDEQQLQRDGYVAALRHPEVVQAIRSGGYGRIAVTYIEWAGDHMARTVVPWTVIDGEATADAFAARLAAAPLQRARRTSISRALAFSETLFAGNGFSGLRRVIDVSGDGPNNQGVPVTAVRDRIVSEGVTINGLPVMLKTSNPGGFFNLPELDIYYEDCVIGGFGAFIVPVQTLTGFAAAVRRKLVLEIAGPPPQVTLAQFAEPAPR
ncbi:MAG TPA: DUF1194 domain-containing protein, partial [Hyphomicrobiales bacterium]|nr:DUF1194 domain-containing protein [Hyphomicrobiales bacterium]